MRGDYPCHNCWHLIGQSESQGQVQNQGAGGQIHSSNRCEEWQSSLDPGRCGNWGSYCNPSAASMDPMSPPWLRTLGCMITKAPQGSGFSPGQRDKSPEEVRKTALCSWFLQRAPSPSQ